MQLPHPRTMTHQQVSGSKAFQGVPLCNRARHCRMQIARGHQCQAKASTKSGNKSKHPFAQPNPKSFRKPGSPGFAPQTQRQQPKQTDQQEAADLASLRQQKATYASKKVLRVSGLQRAAALQGHSPTAEPFSAALTAHKVRSTK